MSEFKPQDIANTAWSFATVNQSDGKLFTLLARAAEQRLGEFNAQCLANTAWALATVKRSDVKLLTALAKAVECSGEVAGERVQAATLPPMLSAGALLQTD